MKRQNIIAKWLNDTFPTSGHIHAVSEKQPRYRNGQWRPTKKVKTVSRKGTVKTVTYYGDWHK